MLELLTDYLEKALSATGRRGVANHLSGCPVCSGRLAQVRATIAVLGRLREGVIPEPVLIELRESFRDP
ncbi:anti-sigma factor family protein [Nonomuraea sp. NPDC002799]